MSEQGWGEGFIPELPAEDLGPRMLFGLRWTGNLASLEAQKVKNLPVRQETQVRSVGLEDAWRREWLPTRVFLPEKFYGQKSLAGYSPQGHKEWDTPEQLTHFSSNLETAEATVASNVNPGDTWEGGLLTR